MQHINKHKLVNRLRSIADHGLFKFGFVAVGVVATFGIATKVLPKVSPTWASPGPQLAPIYLSEFGTKGSGSDQLSGPSSMEIDSQGNFFITDSGNNRVQRFSSNGTHISSFGASFTHDSINDSLNSPVDTAIDSQGNFYVADANNNRVVKFNSSGAYVSEIKNFGTNNDDHFTIPVEVAVDSNDNLFVTDGGVPDPKRIVKFDSTGTYLTEFGTSFNSGDSLSSANDTTIDSSDNIYVQDTGNSRIVIFDDDGVYESEFDVPGAGGVGLDENTGGTSLDVYVTNQAGDYVQRYSTTGALQTQFGSAGSGDGQLDSPGDVAVDSQGSIYVLDSGNGRVEKFGYVHDKSLTTPSTDGVAEQGKAVELSTPSANILEADTKSEFDSSIVKDPLNSYPLGLVHYKLDVVDGAAKTDVTISFATNLNPSDVKLRQYDPVNHTFSDISNVAKDSTTVDGEPGIKFTYINSVGSTPGIIENTVGVAKANTATMDLDSPTDNIYSTTPTPFTLDATNGGANDVNIMSGDTSTLSEFDPNLTSGKDPMNIYPYGLVKLKLDVLKGASVEIKLTGLDTTGMQLISYTGSTNTTTSTADSSNSITLTDSDNDGIIEDIIGLAKPNTTNKDFAGGITMTVPDTSNIVGECSGAQTITTSGPTSTTPNAKYLYPLPLVSYCLDVMPGATEQVTITWQTSLRPDQVQPQKYDPNTNTYDNLDKDDYSLTQVQQGGSNALQLTYDVTDSGSLDADTDSGFIVDPITLAHPTTPAQPGGGSGGGAGTGGAGNGSGNGTNKPTIKTPTVKLSPTLSSNGGKGGATPGAYRADGSLVPGAPDTGGGILSNLMNANLTSVMLAGTITMLMAGSLLVMGKVNKQ